MLKPKNKAIISLHGIRTRGEWQTEPASVISAEGWTYFPLDYGYFSKDDELPEAVRRFEEMLRLLISGPRSDCSETAKVIRMEKLPGILA